MILDEYKTIKTEGEGYYTEKRSKFLAFAHHVESVEQIKDLLAGYRKKYYDARHVCYAYMLGPERTEFRANDDGEPSSTAGKPILGQINSNELTDILIVVVRYYGGVNLGTSGLIVAYRLDRGSCPCLHRWLGKFPRADAQSRALGSEYPHNLLNSNRS